MSPDTTASQLCVSLRNLSKTFYNNGRSLTALLEVDLDVRPGEFVAIIGPSGCGKSTLLRLVGGLLSPSQGRVLIRGRSPQDAQKEKEVGFVFQDPGLLPWRTLLGNVALPLEVNRRARRSDPADAMPLGKHAGRRGTASHQAPSPRDLLALVGLAEFEGYYPWQLSGGMQQRAALARSLAFGPSLLLMDEPFGSLDELTREAMRYELLRLLQGAGGEGHPIRHGGSPTAWEPWPGRAGYERTVLFVTHSIPEAVLLADRVVVLSPRPGRVVADLAIDLPRPRPPSLEEERDFQSYTSRLRHLLREQAPEPHALEARTPGHAVHG